MKTKKSDVQIKLASLAKQSSSWYITQISNNHAEYGNNNSKCTFDCRQSYFESRGRDESKIMHHDNYNTAGMMLLLAKTLLIVYLDTAERIASVHGCTTSHRRNFIVLNDQAYSMLDRIREVFDFGSIRYFLQKPARDRACGGIVELWPLQLHDGGSFVSNKYRIIT